VNVAVYHATETPPSVVARRLPHVALRPTFLHAPPIHFPRSSLLADDASFPHCSSTHRHPHYHQPLPHRRHSASTAAEALVGAPIHLPAPSRFSSHPPHHASPRHLLQIPASPPRNAAVKPPLPESDASGSRAVQEQLLRQSLC
jgi:hypothetical protein